MDDPDAPAEDPKPSTGFPPGRRKGQRVDRHRRPDHYYEMRRRFVEGEGIERLPDGNFVRKFLSFRELARAYSVHHSVVFTWAKRDKWREARIEFEQKVRDEIEKQQDEKAARQRASEVVDALSVTDEFLGKWTKNMREGKVRMDTINDFDKASRLKVFLQREGKDPNGNQAGAVSLETLQQQHAAQRAKAASLPSEAAGVSDDERTGDVDEDGTIAPAVAGLASVR